MSSVNLLEDRLLVKRIKNEKSAGGLHLPDYEEGGSAHIGEVHAVGEGRKLESGKVIPMHVKQGDKIVYSKFGGQEVKIDDVSFLVLREQEVLAVIYG